MVSDDRTFYSHLLTLSGTAAPDVDRLSEKALFESGEPCVSCECISKGGEITLENGERIEYAALAVRARERWPKIDFACRRASSC